MIDAAHGQKLCGDWISEMSLSNVQTMSCYSYILLGWFHFCLKYIPKNRWIVCLKFIKQLPSNEQFMYQCPLEISSLCFFHDFNLCICFLASLSQYIYIYIILYYSRHWWLRKTLYQQSDHLRRYVLSRRTFGPLLFRESAGLSKQHRGNFVPTGKGGRTAAARPVVGSADPSKNRHGSISHS